MPYNTNAIPRKRKADWDGTSYLPLARVRKIIKLDDDIDACTPAAAFLISIAAEEFIWHIAEQAHKMTKVEKKPRKNIQYKDLANAVARIDNLEFLADVVPRTVPFGKAMMKKMIAGGGIKKGGGSAAADEGTAKVDKGIKGAIMNISGREEDGSDGSSPSSETTRLKDLHLSQPTGSGTKKGRRSPKDQDGDLTMQ